MRAREEKALTPQQLAAMLDWDVQRLHAVESGKLPNIPLFEICELAEALDVTTYYIELGLKNMNGHPIRDKVKKLHQSATNFVLHCKEHALLRFERHLLWTKVMEQYSHRSVITRSAWRQHHVRIFGSLNPIPAESPRAEALLSRKKPRPASTKTPCLHSDPNFLRHYAHLLNCPFCGELLL